MADNNNRIYRKIAPYIKDMPSGMSQLFGTQIGIIKNNLDPTRSGRLQIYIPQFGGVDENDPTGWLTVNYASPFRGQTRRRVDVDLYIDKNTDINADITSVDENSFQSYGMWFVVPDLNNKVLCTFVNGDPAQGYWFACIADPFDSHMLPGIGAVTASTNNSNSGGYVWDPTKYATHKDLQQYIELIDPNSGDTEIPYRLPVSEPVLTAQKDSNSPALVQMVPQVAQTRQLGIQGLAFDFIRGSTSAASIRENPSQVFGISTPGRLSPFANAVLSQQTLSQIGSFINSGNSSAQTDTSSLETALTQNYRAGGHQFVMDDGSVEGLDQGIRIRSAGGSMILLDDTNGQVYIINASGNAWIEMSPSGFIDIFSNSDYSVRSKGNINLHADQDISINAIGNLNLKGVASTTVESGSTLNVRSADDMIVFSAGDLGVGTAGALSLYCSGDGSLQSDGDITINGQQTNINSGSGDTVDDPGALPTNKLIDVSQISGRQVWWQNTKFDSIVARAPAHEPWPNHEINGIKTFDVTQGSVSSGITRSSTTTSSGVRGTSTGQAINESQIAKQPTPLMPLCGLTSIQTQALYAQIGQRESSGNYQATNQFGFLGKYQMGASALQDAGYVKSGTSQAGLQNPNNWTGKNGCTSASDYLNNPSAQEDAMNTYSQKNCKALTNAGVINADTDADDRGGYLQVAHLLGVGGAKQFAQYQNNQAGGVDGTDANGTTASSYFALGSNSVNLGTSYGNAGT